METLVVVAQHRNHQYSRTKANGGLAAGFESSPSRCFREISCRTFQSGAAGILPTPLKARKTAEIVQAPPAAAAAGSVSDETYLKPKAGSTPIPIKAKPVNDENFFYDEFSSGSMSFAELWAGPAYSNSPPPSSLPIPKFSLRPKRTVSLDLPSSASDDVVMHHPIAKSAPSSPTGDRKLSSKAFFHSADSATQTLRRILNLDATDD
ncbi:uncharacterized protein LOC104456984 [Eucalyptus grandis]|uniref:Uncharacterized protein n=3 Tax=Eucalyptus TaxID=3932 RepID=A0ACC3JNX8_EUCGR|nr:uncharacterized protein LOC104456984 [Eucalyptus grandis]XP_010070192.1 uncharacterized protein LOC104456984 [Eucalyptus grandis]KAK3415807.1 hypothetical protein EUGRSUZ_H01463 [Eucalyptus grandis]